MIGDYGLNDVQRKEKRKCSNPKTEADRRVLYKGYPLYLPSQEVIEAFKKAYPDNDNQSLKAITGHSVSYNSRLGNYFGLEKSEAFKARREEHAIKALHNNHTKGKPQKGVSPPWLIKTQFGQPNGNKRKPRTEEEIRRFSEQRKEQVRMERMREAWGLPRKTKIRISHQTHIQYSQRYQLRKRGYVEVEMLHFIYSAETKRSKYYESIPDYKFYTQDEWEHRNDKAQNVTAIHTWEDKQGGFKFV